MTDPRPMSGFHLEVLPSTTPAGLSRRSFLQWLGSASIATLGAGCRPPKDPIAPYGDAPPGLTPGNPRHYATAMAIGGFASGLLVTSYEGRPTKIEGNPRFPMNLGASGVWEQASLLQLYDPARAREILFQGQPIARASFVAGMQRLARRLDKDQGARLRLLLEPSTSPLLGSVLERLKSRYPRARVVTWSPTASSAAVEGAALAVGQPLSHRLDLTRADVIAALDSDLLGIGPEAIRLAREFADRRVDTGALNRLYAVEPSMTVTGSAADHRLPLPGAAVHRLAMALLDEVLLLGGQQPLGTSFPEHGRFITALARDLWSHRGASAVLAGDRQPPAVHAVALVINQLLGNLGATVQLFEPAWVTPPSSAEDLKALCAELTSGEVDVFATDVFNPIYTLPADLLPSGLFARVSDSIYLGTHADQSFRSATWAVPSAHPLESWGDCRSPEGTVALTQPLIENLHTSLQLEEVLSGLTDPVMRSAHDQLTHLWVPKLGVEAWRSALQGGLIADTSHAAVTPAVRDPRILEKLPRPPEPPSNPELELSVSADYSVFDGRFARNPWLQEMPDPITKITWDNAVMLNATTAQRLDLQNHERVEIEVGGRTSLAAVNIVQGQADGTATLTLGYGQGDLQGDADGPIGFNAYPLRTSTSPWFLAGARIRGTRQKYSFAITQGGELSQQGRDLAIAIDRLDPGPGTRAVREHRQPQDSLYPPVLYPGYQWAMSIDLSRCTGCSACVIACVAENNIPVVGKREVANGREMQWIRVDRYLEGTGPSPEVVQQPTPCMHCENAPCEYVCPVNATVHSDEGLNEMVYNRCVGTRYCSNNCPYKVRRFNFLGYNNDLTPLQQMQKNPEVTVRSRGVMEKCTYCVQRIEKSRIHAEEENRPIGDELVTACQQACPTRAISFGTLSDPQSAVSRQRADPRRYDMLHELGTRPRTTYLAKLTNKNPELA